MKIINESLTKQSDILNDVYNSKKEKPVKVLFLAKLQIVSLQLY